jgi:predicted DNA-binding protein
MLQLELGEEIEGRLHEAAKEQGVTVDTYVRERIVAQLSDTGPVDDATLERQREAIRELSTFAKDRGIDVKLPSGMSVREYISEAMGF